ncbi:hypothetical protein ACN9JG_21235 (plasmid) [Cereibacter azotoformans]|uniref:hypothetical protein n=1 Tax=Cereibacter azotoformans TaxID=43057 RepID=UPI003B21B94E
MTFKIERIGLGHPPPDPADGMGQSQHSREGREAAFPGDADSKSPTRKKRFLKQNNDPALSCTCF